MIKRFIVSLLVGMLIQVGLSAKTITIYVSPDGRDAWTGLSPTPPATGQDGPLATLPAALRAARRARAESDPANQENQVSIILRGGSYNLTEPLTLTPADSGASQANPLVIAAYPGEKPLISGGRRITGWHKVASQEGLWTTEIPEVRDGQWYFHQLFINGSRKQRARTPNQGFFRIQGDSPQDHPIKLKYKAGDIKKAWADRGDVEVVAFLAWADFRQQIRSVDESERVATLAGNPSASNRENNAQYYVENAPDALDMPGEWYLDRKTGQLTYWAEPGEDLNQSEAVAPRLAELVRLQGDFTAKNPVQNIVLRDLAFAYSDWSLGEHGYADVQAAIPIHGNVFGEGVVNCTIEKCRFEHLAGYALEFGKGCQRVRLQRNEIADIGAGGVRLGEQTKREDPFEQNHHNEISNNHIHHLGQVYKPAVGVLVLQSGQNRIAHNHIHDLYYTAISVGWNWGYQETPCRDNLIEFNHLHDIGQGILSDMGAIYTLGIQKGTVIRNNLIHDVNAFTYGGWGIYPDEGSTDILIENNIVYRTKSAGFHQHYGRENVVRNNIFAFGKEHQLMRTREEAHQSFTFTNNIVYFDSGDLLGSNWSNDHYFMDRNLYYNARPGAAADSVKFAGATLNEWRRRGHDTHSLIADPLFVDAQRYDFRLQPNSPALEMGFQPIDANHVGISPE